MQSRAWSRLILLVVLALAPPFVLADDPCAAFTWDVGHERTLFSHEPRILTAGESAASAPTLTADRLYQLQLKFQSDVAFVAPPGGKPPGEQSWGGLAKLTVDTSGVYRIALDQAAWVDVLVNGAPVSARDFQGRPGCSAPHKIVEFLLPGRTPITLQLSGTHTPAAKVTVTRAPGATH
jgi:hypothetical protein